MAIHTAILIVVSIALAVGALAVIIYRGYNAHQFSQSFAGENISLVTDPGDLKVIKAFEAEQRNLLRAFVGLLVGAFVLTGITAATSGALPGHPEQANASALAVESSEAKAGLGYYLVEKVNAVQVKQVLGEGDITTSPEVHQDYVTKATGYEDGYTTPYSGKNLNEAAARTETQNAVVDKTTRKGNIYAAYGYIAAIVYLTGSDLGDMPDLQRLMSVFPAKGAEAFYEHEGGQIKVSKTDDSFFYNEDGKLLLAIAYELFGDGHLKFYGTGHYQTRVNWHSNAALVDSDRRIVENPIQYEGDFYVWGYEWKGHEFEYFGTNCGASNGIGYGDKRPALFAEPEPEPGYTPPTGGGDTPPTGGGGGTPPTDDKDKPTPKPPTDDQNIKDPSQDPVNKGNAPVGGGKNDDPGPGTFEKDDHPATSSGASPDAGNDDGTSDPSNQVQNPGAAQDNSEAPKVEEIPVTKDTTVTDNQSGQTTNTSKEEKPNKGMVDPD